MCKSPANWLMHPEKISPAGVSAPKKCYGPKKCFGRTDVDSQPYDSPLSHVDLIFHFHKYFSPVAKKYLFEVKQILLTDLFVSHLAPFEFDTGTPLQ